MRWSGGTLWQGRREEHCTIHSTRHLGLNNSNETKVHRSSMGEPVELGQPAGLTAASHVPCHLPDNLPPQQTAYRSHCRTNFKAWCTIACVVHECNNSQDQQLHLWSGEGAPPLWPSKSMLVASSRPVSRFPYTHNLASPNPTSFAARHCGLGGGGGSLFGRTSGIHNGMRGRQATHPVNRRARFPVRFDMFGWQTKGMEPPEDGPC